MEDKIFSLIENNSLQTLVDYLEIQNTCVINKKNKANESPLIVAAFWDRLEVIEVLLKYLPDINSTNDDGNTALMIAVINGSLRIVELLLNGGTNLDIKNHDGGTALHLASIHGYVDISKLLIQIGSDLNIQCSWGGTALMIAAYYGHVEIVRQLVSSGANPSIRCKRYKSALDYAIQYDRFECRDVIRQAWELREKHIEVEKKLNNLASITPVLPENLENISHVKKEFNEKELEAFHLEMEAKANGLSLELVNLWRQINIQYKSYLIAQELKSILSIMEEAKTSKDFLTLKTLKSKRDTLIELSKSSPTLEELQSNLSVISDALQLYYKDLMDKEEDFDAAQKCDVIMTAVNQMKLGVQST